MEPHDLMKLPEVAALLRKNPAQMHYMRSKKQGPPSAKIGGLVFYRRADVEKWINAQFEREAS